jgi:hypothetical protein
MVSNFRSGPADRISKSVPRIVYLYGVFQKSMRPDFFVVGPGCRYGPLQAASIGFSHNSLSPVGKRPQSVLKESTAFASDWIMARVGGSCVRCAREQPRTLANTANMQSRFIFLKLPNGSRVSGGPRRACPPQGHPLNPRPDERTLIAAPNGRRSRTVQAVRLCLIFSI